MDKLPSPSLGIISATTKQKVLIGLSIAHLLNAQSYILVL